MSSTAVDESEGSPLLPENRFRQLAAESNDGPNISPIVSASLDGIVVRRPLQYHSINPDPQNVPHGRDPHAQAALSRYRYYSRLAPHRNSVLLMPHHVVPAEYFLVIPIEPVAGNQSSIITIFSIWNTMMGTSILSMPWALRMAGFSCGIGLMLLMAAITLYTAYRVMKSPNSIDSSSVSVEFSDVCRYYLGRWGDYVSVVFSLVALLGAAVVYWVLMSNFLYHTVEFIYDKANNEFINTTGLSPVANFSYTDAFCPHPPSVPQPPPVTTMPPPNTSVFPTDLPGFDSPVYSNTQHSDEVFNKAWSQTHTVPFFLLLVLLPLVNFRSPTFFTKFNALGTLSVLYILTFVTFKVAKWGIHLDFEDSSSLYYVPHFQPTFPALTGILSLAYFIHNCVLTIVRNQKHPENNGRDLSIAYICVTFTYIFIGVAFYSAFPLPKDCIEDNLLNNFRSSDTLAFVARIFLFFQMVTVFPLLMFIFRTQFLNTVFGSDYPSLKHVLLLNVVVIGVCVLFAVFLPQIGNIIRFSGALCGLVYIFTLPCLVYMLSRKKSSSLTRPVIAIHCLLILLGTLNFLGQFAIIGKTG